MSSRWYPLYQRGNPQLRVFLPNFWMKLVKPVGYKYPPNVVVFHCHLKMTDRDVKNYLEKIYDIPVVKVDTVLMTGRLKRAIGRNYVIKEDDVRLAKVILPKSEKFYFPDLFPEEKNEFDEKTIKDSKNDFKQFLDKNAKRPGLPGWFA